VKRWSDASVTLVERAFLTKLQCSSAGEQILIQVSADECPDDLRSFVGAGGTTRGVAIEVWESGELRLVHGVVEWRVLVDPDYEAWNLVSDSGERFVSLPGGGLAHWPPSS
jgi:hypothetical protein